MPTPLGLANTPKRLANFQNPVQTGESTMTWVEAASNAKRSQRELPDLSKHGSIDSNAFKEYGDYEADDDGSTTASTTDPGEDVPMLELADEPFGDHMTLPGRNWGSSSLPQTPPSETEPDPTPSFDDMYYFSNLNDRSLS